MEILKKTTLHQNEGKAMTEVPKLSTRCRKTIEIFV